MIEHLWEKYPECGPAPMTHMKHSRVGDASLAALSVHTGLCDMVTGASGVASSIAKYKQAVTAAQQGAEAAHDDSAEDDPSPRTEYWSKTLRNHVSLAPCPKLIQSLGDLAELLMGAVFIDSNYNTEPARRVYRKHFEPFMDRYGVGPTNQSLHPKSVFMVHMASLGCAAWRIDAPVPQTGIQEAVTSTGESWCLGV